MSVRPKRALFYRFQSFFRLAHVAGMGNDGAALLRLGCDVGAPHGLDCESSNLRTTDTLGLRVVDTRDRFAGKETKTREKKIPIALGGRRHSHGGQDHNLRCVWSSLLGPPPLLADLLSPNVECQHQRHGDERERAGVKRGLEAFYCLVVCGKTACL